MFLAQPHVPTGANQPDDKREVLARQAKRESPPRPTEGCGATKGRLAGADGVGVSDAKYGVAREAPRTSRGLQSAAAPGPVRGTYLSEMNSVANRHLTSLLNVCARPVA